MGKIVASVRNGRAIGATATTLTDDIKFGFVAHALHVDTFGLLIASATDTLAGVVGNLGQVRIETTRSQPESTIDGADLLHFDGQIGVPQFITNNTLTVDNQPKAFSMVQPFTPFPNDDTRNYGLPPNRGVQAVIDWNADGTIDNKTYDMTVEGITADIQPSTLGYIKFVRDAFTAGAAGEERKTRVTGNRLLGTENFQTTEYEALAASAANNLVGIRQQAVLESENITLGPYKSFRNWGMNPLVNSIRGQVIDSNTIGAGTQLNQGNFFIDYGIHNSGKLGLNIAGKTIDIRTTAGVAEALRVNPVVLVK